MNVFEYGLVVVVLVHRDDTHQRIESVHVLHNDFASDVPARAARSVELAEVLGEEAYDLDRSLAVVLHHFVFGVARSAVGDGGHAGR